MCKLCDAGLRQNHFNSRRNFLKGAAATGFAATVSNLFAPRPAAADDRWIMDSRVAGVPGRRYVIRGGAVMSMDPKVGDFPQADVLVEGKKILAVGPNLRAGGAAVIDARGRIVMPGFIDTHHHQFETALRSFLADGVLINDGSGSPSGNTTYFEFILLKFAPVYRPQDVYINELFGGLASSTTASRRCTTSRRSITRRSTRTPPSRRCSIPGAAPPSAISRARVPTFSAPIPATNIRTDATAHQEAVVLLERPARPHDHGRRGLSRRSRRPTSPGRSGASSASRLRRTSSRRSASGRSSTQLAAGNGGNGTHRASDRPTTCSST